MPKVVEARVFEPFLQLDFGQTLQQSGTYAVDSAAARALGATPLKPEKSINLSVGLVWQPASNVDVTLDGYRIKITDQILYTDRISMPAGSALANYFNSQVPGQQVTAAQFFTNLNYNRTGRGRGCTDVYGCARSQ